MQTKNVFRVFVHRLEEEDEDWSESVSLRPGLYSDVRWHSKPDKLWYEFYTPEEADACVSAFARRRTLVKGKRDAEVLLPNVILARHRARENFEIAFASEFNVWDWWFGHVIHLTFPKYKGAPVGYYAGYGYEPRKLTACEVQDLAVRHMKKYDNDTLRDCVIFQCAVLSLIG